MIYRLEKLADGEWCLWGRYSDIERLVFAAFELGRLSGVEYVRVVKEENNET